MDKLSADATVEIALAAIEATTRPDHWDHLCDRIAHHLGVGAFMLFPYDFSNRAAPVLHASAAIRSDRAAPLRRMFHSGEAREDHRAYEVIARSEAGQVLGEPEVYGLPAEDPVPKNIFREQLLAVSGSRSRSAMKLNAFGPFLDCAIAHEWHAPGEKCMAMATAPFLWSILARTLEGGRVVAALSRSYATLMTLFDRLDFGAAFCTGAGRIVTANPRFHQIARERDGLVVHAGLLSATTENGTHQLRRTLAQALRINDCLDTLTMTIPRRSGMLPLVVKAAPVRSDHLGPSALVMVLIVDPEDGDRISGRNLEAFDVLTEAELDVCDLLVRGHDTDAIAGRRGTALETTRGQIKSASAKLACRSRLDLLRLAMASHVPVGDVPRPR